MHFFHPTWLACVFIMPKISQLMLEFGYSHYSWDFIEPYLLVYEQIVHTCSLNDLMKSQEYLSKYFSEYFRPTKPTEVHTLSPLTMVMIQFCYSLWYKWNFVPESKPNRLISTLIPCLDLFFLGANWKTKVGPLFLPS